MNEFQNDMKRQHLSFMRKIDTKYDNQDQNIRYGFIITRVLWHRARCYISFLLTIEPQSPLRKAYDQSEFCPYFQLQDKKEENLVVERIELDKVTNHLRLSGALSSCNEWWEAHDSLLNKPKYPDIYQKWQKFSSHEAINSIEQSLKEKYSDDLEILQNSNFNVSSFSNPFEANLKKWTGINYGLNTWSTKHFRCQEYQFFSFKGIRLILVFDRSFYFETITRTYYTSTTTEGHVVTSYIDEVQYFHHYLENFRLFGLKNDKHQVLLTESTNMEEIIPKLISKSWETIFRPLEFCEIFTKTIVHKKPWKDLIETSDIHNLFQVGLILRVKREGKVLPYFHAGVFLGAETIIHVHLEKSRHLPESQQIFQFSTFKDFVLNDIEVHEIQFLIPRFTRSELFEKALKMNATAYKYSVSSNNCEHLAFELVTEMKFSQQLQRIINVILASMADNLCIQTKSVSKISPE